MKVSNKSGLAHYIVLAGWNSDVKGVSHLDPEWDYDMLAGLWERGEPRLVDDWWMGTTRSNYFVVNASRRAIPFLDWRLWCPAEISRRSRRQANGLAA